MQKFVVKKSKSSPLPASASSTIAPTSKTTSVATTTASEETTSSNKVSSATSTIGTNFTPQSTNAGVQSIVSSKSSSPSPSHSSGSSQMKMSGYLKKKRNVSQTTSKQKIFLESRATKSQFLIERHALWKSHFCFTNEENSHNSPFCALIVIILSKSFHEQSDTRIFISISKSVKMTSEFNFACPTQCEWRCAHTMKNGIWKWLFVDRRDKSVLFGGEKVSIMLFWCSANFRLVF